jgi:hypothetical protein
VTDDILFYGAKTLDRGVRRWNIPLPAEVLVAGRSAIATITQSVLVAVVYVSAIVSEVVTIL